MTVDELHRWCVENTEEEPGIWFDWEMLFDGMTVQVRISENLNQTSYLSWYSNKDVPSEAIADVIARFERGDEPDDFDSG